MSSVTSTWLCTRSSGTTSTVPWKRSSHAVCVPSSEVPIASRVDDGGAITSVVETSGSLGFSSDPIALAVAVRGEIRVTGGAQPSAPMLTTAHATATQGSATTR